LFLICGTWRNPGLTTLGYREADELRAAIETLAARSDVDPQRFGVWGYNLGAYAALGAAENDKRIRAWFWILSTTNQVRW